MTPILSPQKRLTLGGILIIGAVLGIIFITPRIDNDLFLGGGIGLLISASLSYLIFPELRKLAKSIWGGNNTMGVNMRNYFVHPTQLAIILGILWFLFFILFTISGLLDPIFTKFENKDRPFLLCIFLSPFCFLIGLSGFLMIKRKEGVNRFGQIYHGFWVYFNGILGIIFGWGFLLIMLLAHILKW